METNLHPSFVISEDLLEAIRSFPTERKVDHCGNQFIASPFALYADCPRCGSRLKLRSFSAVQEIEDVFDAVFEWMNRPGAGELAMQRQAAFSEEDP